MNITKKQFAQIVKESVSKSEVCRKLGIAGNGTGLRKVTLLTQQYNIDISHFSRKAAMTKFTSKYEVVTKPCPVCGKTFETRKGHKREKTTCSHSCSNTFFAEKRNIPSRYKNYKTICFKKWPKKCLVCGYSKIVSVHHLDENHSNNNPDNLIPLCMNCHEEIHHTLYKHEVLNKVETILRGVA
jgi:5-methylcytosine-specific restriction endonuclease McrA